LRVIPVLLIHLAALVVATGAVCAAEPESNAPAPVAKSKSSDDRKIDFGRDVLPLLTARCFDCHGPDSQESGLRVDRRDVLLKGGDSKQPAVVPGKSDASRLITLVSGKDPKRVMPPDGKRLTDREVAILRDWIDQGARWSQDDDDSAQSARHSSADTDFWSLKPVVVPEVPASSDPWVQGAIDAFVLQRLRQEELRPSAEADRRTLIRRLYLDVLGLPPTPDQIARFERDERPDAWSRLIDDVLASPHYGERWARHWLDVVRFAETDGFETNVERPNAWHYRDYVIRALNDDKPYDRFVFEQLAGDAVGADAATGFLVGGPTDRVKSPDVVLTRMQRQDELADMINTTGTAFLGLTLGCAKCHSHKFDPISQTEYYAVAAVFAGVRHGERPLRVPESPRREKERIALGLMDELKGLGLREPVSPRGNVEEFPPVDARYVRFTVLETNSGSEPCLDELEVFAASDESTRENVALASAGAKASASGTYSGSELHKLAHINDGRYGNARSWISPGRDAPHQPRRMGP